MERCSIVLGRFGGTRSPPCGSKASQRHVVKRAGLRLDSNKCGKMSKREVRGEGADGGSSGKIFLGRSKLETMNNIEKKMKGSMFCIVLISIVCFVTSVKFNSETNSCLLLHLENALIALWISTF